MIFPVADLLGLPRDHVFANTILFDAAGKYAGFDREAFTSRSGGKARGREGRLIDASHSARPASVRGRGEDDGAAARARGQARAIEALKAKHGYKTLVMIGDGATDLEARRPGGARRRLGRGAHLLCRSFGSGG